MTSRVPIVSLERAREFGEAMGLPARRAQSEAFRVLANNPGVARVAYSQLTSLAAGLAVALAMPLGGSAGIPKSPRLLAIRCPYNLWRHRGQINHEKQRTTLRMLLNVKFASTNGGQNCLTGVTPRYFTRVGAGDQALLKIIVESAVSHTLHSSSSTVRDLGWGQITQ